ncbi:cell envelope biogenesis protein TolA [Thioclava sp. FR2]|uniref:cell envelope biogenesis protein TolA n=1 Tax=Thioclava sp. FR2 TaxID=3445780 RepID=UPI003EBD48BA
MLARMQTGTIVSGTGHAALILWVILGDWLFAPQETPPVQVAEVSLITSAELDAMTAAVPSTPDPVETPEPAAEPQPQSEPEPIVPPEPVVPEPQPTPEPEPLPVPEPEPAPIPEPAPEPVPEPEPLPENNGVADAEPLPVNPDPIPESPLSPSASPRPKPAPRVAPVPVDAPEPQTEVADVPEEAVSPDPVEQPQVQEEERAETAEEEAGTVLETEANRDQEVAASGAPPTSPRPKGRPVRSTEPPEDTAAPTETAEPATDDVADAIAGAVAEANTETEAPSSSNALAGPPMTTGEKDAFRVAVQRCWNVGSLSSEALRVTVILYVSVSQSGKPDAGSIRMVDFTGGSEAAARQSFEAARRAVIRCGANGFPLPVEKFEQWREMELVFNPDGMRVR